MADLSLSGSGEATMIRFDQRQRAALSETIRDLANLIAAGLVVGQVITDQPRSWLILAGIAVWVAFVGWALLLEGERQWKARF